MGPRIGAIKRYIPSHSSKPLYNVRGEGCVEGLGGALKKGPKHAQEERAGLHCTNGTAAAEDGTR